VARHLHLDAPIGQQEVPVGSLLGDGFQMPQKPARTASVRVPAGSAGRLCRARAAHGWSRAELAAHAGVPPSLITSLESGADFWIAPDVLAALASVLDVEPAWLLTHSVPVSSLQPTEAARRMRSNRTLGGHTS
jgi:ribosome-binding protein aMBF1 (putative translation factor)